MSFRCRYTHYLPLITFCPMKSSFDAGYVTVESSIMLEVFALRSLIYSYRWKRLFVENIVDGIYKQLSSEHDHLTSLKVTYKLIGGGMEVSRDG